MKQITHEMTETRQPLVMAVLTFGALWGLAEATLGFALHLLSRLVPGIGLAGFVMYPVAVAFMLAGYRVTGNAATPLLMSVVAASIKWSSAVLPSVGVLFVANPSLAILAEGTITAAVLVLTARTSLKLTAGIAVGSVAWRGLFIGLVALLPVRKGILMKGPAALMSFLLLEAAVNAVLVTLGSWYMSRQKGRESGSEQERPVAGSVVVRFMLRPAVGAILFIVAVATETALAAV